MASDAWLTLLGAASSSRQSWRKALAAYGTPEALLARSRAELEAFGIPLDKIDTLERPAEAAADRARAWLAQPRRALVTLGSEHYPPLLAASSDPPLALWVEGEDLAVLSSPQLAIVGSRSPTRGGRENAEHFARHLARHDLTITSGLAIGIDAAGHRGALAESGRTIAVLGSGLDEIYPRANARLAAEILSARGLLVSEYPPGVRPEPWRFPERNRIIAGLSLGTLVVEATRRSGSLGTAKCANDDGREVFAIPGSIHNPLARGCHHLIRSGAKLVEDAADILIELAPQLRIDVATVRAEAERRAEPSPPTEDPDYRKLLSLLGFEPRSITDLIADSGLTAAELSSMLLLLELQGLVEALPGGRYSRLAKRDR